MTTIEEAAEKYIADDNNNRYYNDFIAGAKWQEEQQDKFAIDFAEYVLDWNRDTTSDYLQIILEQFKNK